MAVHLIGQLHNAKGQVLDFDPYEISEKCLGFTASSDMSLGTSLSLENAGKSFPMVINHNAGSVHKPRYQIRFKDKTTRFSQLYPDSFQPIQSKLQAIRFPVVMNQKVMIKLFGGLKFHDFVLKNASATGLKLQLTGGKGCDFYPNSLVDIYLKHKDKEIRALGKVERWSNSTYYRGRLVYQGVGLSFVEFVEDDQDSWRDILLELEKTYIK